MRDDFKEKLKAYSEGKLSEEETLEVEKELEKMEVYQSYLDEQLDDETENRFQPNDQKIIRKGKWKARISNAVTAISILILIAFCSSLVNSIFYSWGEPDRIEVYNDVIESAIAVTNPNIEVGSRGSNTGFFFFNNKSDLKKRIGNKNEKVGSFEMNFFYGFPFSPTIEKDIEQNSMFIYPVAENKNISDDHEWERLNHLPEGTVAEAYISLDQLYSTKKLLSLLENYQTVKPAWFAVDTGIEKEEAKQRGPTPTDSIGFPSLPIWHPEDLEITSRETEDKGFYSNVTIEEGTYPNVSDYGSAELRNENFIRTLEIMNEHKRISNRVAQSSDLRLNKRMDYVKNHGVHIYGVVITGPSKEILALRGEDWISSLSIGEVRLWN